MTVAPVTSIIRSIPTELIRNTEDGLPQICAVNFDNLQTVPKANVSAPIGHLSAAQMKSAGAAVAFALGFADL